MLHCPAVEPLLLMLLLLLQARVIYGTQLDHQLRGFYKDQVAAAAAADATEKASISVILLSCQPLKRKR